MATRSGAVKPVKKDVTINAVGAAIAGGLLFPIVTMGVFSLIIHENRCRARALGLCDGRIVTISPWGLSVAIPAARATSLIAIGPVRCSWGQIHSISSSEDDLTFWMQPWFLDPGGRTRVIVPLRAFANGAEAADFEKAARRWHADAIGADPHWWDEANP
jgi:hypothetical protein